MPWSLTLWLRTYTRPSMLLAYGVLSAAALAYNVDTPAERQSKALTKPETAQEYLERCHRLPQPYQKAIEDCTQAIQRDSKLAAAYEQRGWLFKQVGNAPRAIADYQQAQSLYRVTGDPIDIRRTEKVINAIAPKGN